MSSESMRRKLKEFRASLPPKPLAFSEMPVEEWTKEALKDSIDESNLRNSDEEFFFAWHKGLLKRLHQTIGVRALVASGETWDFSEVPNQLPEEVAMRINAVLPYWINHEWKRWQEHNPDRERRRAYAREALKDGPPRTRDNGYEWWFNLTEKNAEIAKEYATWPERWEAFYKEWKKTAPEGLD